MKKYKTGVIITTSATTVIGEVEFDTIEEYNDKANELWESQGYESPSVFACNDFDLGDWDILQIDESDLKYMKNE